MAINFLNNVSVVETAASSDTDKFVVLDSGVLKYRTGAQVRSDIGAGTGDITGVTAGTGLSGGATSGNATLNLDLGELAVGGTLVGSDYLIAENGGVDNRQLISSIPLSIFNNDLPTVNNGTLTMTTSAGLNGGATFTANQSGNSAFSVSLDLSELTDMTADMTSTDEFIVLDNGAERRKAAGEIGLSIFDNDEGFITSSSLPTVNNATINISAGTDMTGGGTFTTNQGISGTITVNHADTSPLSGTYGSTSDGTKIDQITVDARGHVTAITTGATGSGNGTVTGSGDANYVSKWTSSSAQGNSTIYDDGEVGIGTSNPGAKLDVNQDAAAIAFNVTGGSGGVALATFTRDVGATGSSVSINAQSNFPQIQFANTGNTFSIGGDTSGNFKISDNTSIGTNDRITIDNTGDVGIGTTNPDAKLHVSGGDFLLEGDYRNFYIGGKTNNSEDGIRMSLDNTGNGYFDHRGAGNLHFRVDASTGATTRMVIEDTGNVGIGTTSPAAKLEVEGGDHLLQLSTTSSSGSPYLSFNQAGTRRSFIQHADGGDTLKIASEYGGIDFYTGTSGSNSEKMTIQSDGDVGINVTSPSSKLHVRKAAGPLSSFNSNTIGIYETSGPGYVNIVTGATSTGELWFSDSSEGRGRVRYNHSDDSLQFWVANGEKLRVGVNGEIGIGGANYGTSGDVLTSNGSGFAPSWQAAGGGGASITSGTWTPSVTSSLTTSGLYPPSVTPAGYYEKIGDNVTVSFRLGFRAYNAAVNWTLTNITNLPYTVQNLGSWATSVQFLTYNSMSANTTTDAAYVAAGTTNVIFTESGNLTQTFTLPAYGISFVTGVVTYKAS